MNTALSNFEKKHPPEERRANRLAVIGGLVLAVVALVTELTVVQTPSHHGLGFLVAIMGIAIAGVYSLIIMKVNEDLAKAEAEDKKGSSETAPAGS